MHKALLRLLGFDSNDAEAEVSSADTETVRKIVGELNHLPTDRARFVAAFAYILSRVAHADLEISDDETQAMELIVRRQGKLPEEHAILVVQMAKTQSLLFGGTENYLVVKEFGRIASREEKLDLLRCLFAVAASDESVSTVENNVVRQISDELMLDHSEFIAVRADFRDRLGVLKKSD